MRFFTLNTRLHKWLSLLVGLQLIIWLATGLYFNLMDHHKARGHEFRAHVHSDAKMHDFDLFPVSEIKSDAPLEVKLVWVLDYPYYHFVFDKGAHTYQASRSTLFDAVTGAPFNLAPHQALQIAKASYSGTAAFGKPTLVQPPFAEDVKQQNAMWKVNVEDENNTVIYLDFVTGRVLRHVNDDVRLKDLMMKLHFMDYADTGGFNHWLIILFAIATLLLAASGVTWLVHQYKSGLLRLSWGSKTRILSVTFAKEQTSADISVEDNQTLLQGLAKSHIYLASSCGGGGTCGKCTFLSAVPMPITPSEQAQLSAKQLKLGYRLACQHKVSDVSDIEVDTCREIETHELEVVATQFLTPFIKEVKCKVKSAKPLSFKAGAYMQFKVPAGVNPARPTVLPAHFEPYWQDFDHGQFSHEGAVRHYSLANFDQEGDELIFNIRWQTAEQGVRAGVGSSYLGALQPGDTLMATGPYSDFYANSRTDHQEMTRRIFIGAGSGLAPLRAIIFEALKKHHYRGGMTLIYGARTEDDLLYRDELEALEQQYSNFSYMPTLSSPSKQWQGHSGYVQQVLAPVLNKELDATVSEYYLCGPEAMMHDVESMLIAAGVVSENIFKHIFSR